MKIAVLRLSTAAVAAAAVVTLAACGGSSSASGGSANGKTTITLLTDNADTTVKSADAVIAAFEKANPDITVKTETRPGGSEGDNIVKTKLATGEIRYVILFLHVLVSPFRTRAHPVPEHLPRERVVHPAR